ncbi:unnamed protein product [Victoria cruziana]
MSKQLFCRSRSRCKDPAALRADFQKIFQQPCLLFVLQGLLSSALYHKWRAYWATQGVHPHIQLVFRLDSTLDRSKD